MILYLIRHGRTDSYENNFRQAPNTPLGEYGLNQAKLMAQKLKVVKIDHLYSSDWPRAFQTAEMLSKTANVKVKIHPKIHENQKNPVLDNTPLDSEVNRRFLKERDENRYNLDWKFDGEGESANDLLKRAKTVLDFLIQKHSTESVVIVSHALFIGVMIGLILLGPDSDEGTFIRFFERITVNNTGITSFKYNPEKKKWKLLTLNDYSHLEDGWVSSHNEKT